MLEVKKDDKDKVIAYLEWQIVNKHGIGREDGEYLFVRDIWIHKDYERKNIIREFIEKIRYQTPYVLWIYWQRKKYNDRVKLFSKGRFKWAEIQQQFNHLHLQ